MARRKFNKLKYKMGECDVIQKDIPPLLGRKASYVSSRMTGRKPWNTDEIKKISGLLGIPREQWLDYFFDP